MVVGLIPGVSLQDGHITLDDVHTLPSLAAEIPPPTSTDKEGMIITPCEDVV